jgi:transposase InsO family protein
LAQAHCVLEVAEFEDLIDRANVIFVDLPPGLDDARSKISDWRTPYNHVRPHSSLG